MTKIENTAESISYNRGGTLVIVWERCALASKLGPYWSEQGNVHGSGSLGHNVG
jgi:hypothetical protein